MNLLEYSFSSAGTKVDFGTRSVSFTKVDSDPISRELVERRLKISFSAEYGRPTIEDDELYLGLLLLTKLAGCKAPQVSFTQYELIEAARMTKRGDTYRRIDMGFNRLKGVQFDFKRAFFDNQAKCWVDRKFGLIDDVKLYNRSEYERVRETGGAARPRGWFKWGDAVFESFVAGFIKTLDLDIYHSLQGNIARKMFRWFDKEWHHKQRLRIDLHRFAEEKLGAKRGQPRSELVRLLAPGFEELKTRGLIGPVKMTELSKGRAELQVLRPKGEMDKARTAGFSDEQKMLVEALSFRGVRRNGKTGPEDLVRSSDPGRIQRVIETFDFLKKSGSRKSAGWIVSACLAAEEFEAPEGLLRDRSERENARMKRTSLQKQQQMRTTEFSELERDRLEAERRERLVEERLTGLSPEAKKSLEEDALQHTPAELRRAYAAAQKLGDGVFFQKARTEVLYAFLNRGN